MASRPGDGWPQSDLRLQSVFLFPRAHPRPLAWKRAAALRLGRGAWNNRDYGGYRHPVLRPLLQAGCLLDLSFDGPHTTHQCFGQFPDLRFEKPIAEAARHVSDGEGGLRE